MITRFVNYYLGGPTLTAVYTEVDMAAALGITESELVTALNSGIGLSYHAHPSATGEGYWFKEESYQNNQKVWTCHTSGGHQFDPDPKYSYLPNGAKTCAKCGHIEFP